MSESFAELVGQAMTDLMRFTKLVVKSVHLQAGVIKQPAEWCFPKISLTGTGRFQCSSSVLHSGIMQVVVFLCRAKPKRSPRSGVFFFIF